MNQRHFERRGKGCRDIETFYFTVAESTDRQTTKFRVYQAVDLPDRELLSGQNVEKTAGETKCLGQVRGQRMKYQEHDCFVEKYIEV